MSASTAGLHWIRPPRQARSRATLDRLLDAAEQLIAEKGFEDTSVAEVARLAKSSVGAFYARFADKNALIYAVYDRYLEQAMATSDASLDPARWEGASAPEILRAVVRFLVEIYRTQRGLIRAFAVRNHCDSEFAARQGRLSHYVNSQLSALLLARREEITHPDPVRAASFGLTLVFSTLEGTMLFGEMRSSDLVLSDDDLAAELTRAYLAYLGFSDPTTCEPAQALPRD